MSEQPTTKRVPVTPYRWGEDQVEAMRRNSDELEQAVEPPAPLASAGANTPTPI